ncbi:hypothetical protein F5Y16DRAFT_401938 [Xylariaceae sp. FL0255]|nr:hypothetical protein F5Y16DRAFT_401938 [Xylariaceae sp. FL0255]
MLWLLPLVAQGVFSTPVNESGNSTADIQKRQDSCSWLPDGHSYEGERPIYGGSCMNPKDRCYLTHLDMIILVNRTKDPLEPEWGDNVADSHPSSDINEPLNSMELDLFQPQLPGMSWAESQEADDEGKLFQGPPLNNSAHWNLLLSLETDRKAGILTEEDFLASVEEIFADMAGGNMNGTSTNHSSLASRNRGLPEFDWIWDRAWSRAVVYHPMDNDCDAPPKPDPPLPGDIPKDVILKEDGTAVVFVKTTCSWPPERLGMEFQDWRYRAPGVALPLRLREDIMPRERRFARFVGYRVDREVFEVAGKGWLPHTVSNGWFYITTVSLSREKRTPLLLPILSSIRYDLDIVWEYLHGLGPLTKWEVVHYQVDPIGGWLNWKCRGDFGLLANLPSWITARLNMMGGTRVDWIDGIESGRGGAQ